MTLFIAAFLVLFGLAFVFALALGKAAKLGDRYERPEPVPTAWVWPEREER